MRVPFKDRAARDRGWITSELFDELERWVDHGLPPSQFVRLVLINDLRGAANQASPVNQALLCWIARFVDRNVPWQAKASDKAMAEWKGRENMPEDDPLQRY